MYRRARVYGNAAVHHLLERHSDRTVSSIDASVVAEFLAGFDDHDTVFVHVGLSDVKRAIGRDPYAFLLDLLDEHFETVLAPGFTPSFRSSGVYHKRRSRPEFGTFSRLFLDDADYRTDDPIHSILVRGPYRFDGCDHHDTFGPGGCWAQLDRDDVLILDIGTDWIVSTQHHYIEHRAGVPYLETATYEGTIYYDDTDFSAVSQRSYAYDMPLKRNALGVQRHLERHGVLRHDRPGGLLLMGYTAGDLRRALVPATDKDPYFLVGLTPGTVRGALAEVGG